MRFTSLSEARDHIVNAVKYVPNDLGTPLADLVVKARIRRGQLEITVFDSRDVKLGALAWAFMPANGLSAKMACASVHAAIQSSAPLAKTIAAIRAELVPSNVSLFPKRSAA